MHGDTDVESEEEGGVPPWRFLESQDCNEAAGLEAGNENRVSLSKEGLFNDHLLQVLTKLFSQPQSCSGKKIG